MPDPNSELVIADAPLVQKTGVDDSELDKLRLALKETESARAADQAEINRLRGETQTAQRQVLQHADVSLRSREAQVDTAIQAIDGELVTLQDQIADAQGRGDFKTSAALTVKVGGLQARKVQQETFKSHLEGEKQRIAQPRTADANVYTDASGSQHDLSAYHPETQKWIRSNPKFLTDPGFQQKVIRADAKAFGSGIDRNTPEYFEFVETETGLRQPSKEIVVDDTPPAKPNRTSSTAAPVSRSTTGTPSGSTARSPDLTAEEAEVARISDPELFRKDPAACYNAYKTQRDAIKSGARGGIMGLH